MKRRPRGQGRSRTPPPSGVGALPDDRDMMTIEPQGRASTAMGWSAIALVLSKGAVLVSTLLLARVLLPADFGLFAVGLLVINYLDRIKDVGLGAALVYQRGKWSQLAGTGLPISMISSLVLAATTYAIAPFAADFFGDPRAVEIVRVLAISLLISGFAIVPDAYMRRTLNFRARAIPDITSSILKGIVSVSLAYAGLGVWSLVWGQLVASIVQTTLYWLLSTWRPRFDWNPAVARDLLRYGIPASLVSVFAVVIENIDYLVIGREMEPADLGYYTLAFRVPELTVIAVCLVTSTVLFPMFSRLQDNLDELRLTYLRAVHYVSLVTIPGGLLITVLAPELVYTLFSDRWAPAIPVLRLLGLFSVVYAMSFQSGDIYKSTGRPGILNWIALVKLVVFVPALWWAAQYSITVVALAVVLTNVLISALELYIVQRILRFPGRSLVGAFAPSLAVGAILAVSVLALVSFLREVAVGLGDPLRLATCCLVGLPVYVGLVRVLAPEAFAEALVLVRSRGLAPPPSERPTE